MFPSLRIASREAVANAKKILPWSERALELQVGASSWPGMCTAGCRRGREVLPLLQAA